RVLQYEKLVAKLPISPQDEKTNHVYKESDFIMKGNTPAVISAELLKISFRLESLESKGKHAQQRFQKLRAP
ncbi:hypothetical protein OnM2_005020, partial [Erysiphe neolycopersici]